MGLRYWQMCIRDRVYQELAKKLKEPASTTKLDMDTASIGIVVADQKNQELTRDEIRDMKLDVKKQDGSTEQIALKDIASFETGYGLQSISRNAQSRYINVTAEVAAVSYTHLHCVQTYGGRTDACDNA